MNSIIAFILLELFILSNFKKVNNTTLFNFRHIITSYLSDSSSYDEFMSLLSNGCLLLDKDVCSLCLSFKRYLKKAYDIWEGNDVVFGYLERYSQYRKPEI